jgi:hydroxyacylglutathione hydrolase
MASLTQHTIATPYMVGPVHCYTGILDGDLVLFDTGPPTPEGQKYFKNHIDLPNLKHIIITHCHIDHYGQTHWLEENCDATIYLPYRDGLKIVQHDSRILEMYQLLRDVGFSEEYLTKLRLIFDSGELFPPFPQNFKIAEKDIPERLGVRVVECPGHSQSDLVYVGEDWAVTGDTLLRGIFQSPLLDVDLETGERFKNYEMYCATLTKLFSLHGKTVLPGHRYKVRSVEDTLIFYVTKLLQRVEQLRPYVAENDVMVLIDKVFDGKVKDVFHIFLKASEILFMKDFLNKPELLHHVLEKTGLFHNVRELYDSAVAR